MEKYMDNDFLHDVGLRGRWSSAATSSSRLGILLTEPAPSDRATVHIPYAGETIKLTVMIDPENPDIAPDIVMDDGSFPCVELSRRPLSQWLPALDTWRPDDADGLDKLLGQLVASYRQHVLAQLSDCRQLLEACRRVEDELLEGQSELMEPWLLSGGGAPDQLKLQLLVKLPVDVDVNCLPPPPTRSADDQEEQLNPGPPCALLLLRLSHTAQVVRSRLWLSPWLHALLHGGGGGCKLPLCSPLVDCVEYARQTALGVNQQLALFTHAHNCRRQLTAALLAEYKEAVLRYDPVRYSCVVLLCGGGADEDAAVAEVALDDYPRRPAVGLYLTAVSDRWRREQSVPCPAPTAADRPPQLARLVRRRIDELLDSQLAASPDQGSGDSSDFEQLVTEDSGAARASKRVRLQPASRAAVGKRNDDADEP